MVCGGWVHRVLLLGLSLASSAEIFNEYKKIWMQASDEYTRKPNGQIAPDAFVVDEVSIFIGISSYQDVRCATTLWNAFTKAKNPERITIGVVQQNAVYDEDCIASYCKLWSTRNGTSSCPFKDQVTIKRVHARDATGPVTARHKQQGLIKSEEFCLQVDAHSDFAYGWDHMLLNDYTNSKNKYAVLTTYPHPTTELKSNPKTNGQSSEVPHLCLIDINGGGMPRNGRARRIRKMLAPRLASLWAAGLSFSLCDAERKVRNDPSLDYVFDGEEYSRAVRLWTSGYDFYTPTTAAVFHDYSKSGTVVKFPFDYKMRDHSHERIKELLTPFKSRAEHEANFGAYGMGTKRTLEQFAEFTGIWPWKYPRSGYKRGRNDDNCRPGALVWVPYSGPMDDALHMAQKQAKLQQGQQQRQGKGQGQGKQPIKIVRAPQIPRGIPTDTFDPAESWWWLSAKICIFCVVAVVGVTVTMVTASVMFGDSGGGEEGDWSSIQRGGGGSLLGDGVRGGSKKPVLALVLTTMSGWMSRVQSFPCSPGALLGGKRGGHMD
jgi:hypothetical protein